MNNIGYFQHAGSSFFNDVREDEGLTIIAEELDNKKDFCGQPFCLVETSKGKGFIFQIVQIVFGRFAAG